MRRAAVFSDVECCLEEIRMSGLVSHVYCSSVYINLGTARLTTIRWGPYPYHFLREPFKLFK